MKRTFTVALLLAPMVSVLAQDMSPPKEVASLGWLSGTWSGTGKVSFGGHETAIDTKITFSFDGQFLKAASTDESSGFKMTKTAMIGWDAAKSEYTSYTFTNIAPKARIEHGKMDGGKLVLVSEPWEAEGMKSVMRETISKISDTKCGLLLELKQGDKWDKEMDYILTKH